MRHRVKRVLNFTRNFILEGDVDNVSSLLIYIPFVNFVTDGVSFVRYTIMLKFIKEMAVDSFFRRNNNITTC